ncbi:MAG: hypothetical protein QXU97_00990 [Fervidicoccaceae archaeon]
MERSAGSRLDEAAELALRYELRLGVELEELLEHLPPFLRQSATELSRLLLASLAERGRQGLSCALCDRGPFTNLGFYLHVMRVHPVELKIAFRKLVEEELEAGRRDQPSA